LTFLSSVIFPALMQILHNRKPTGLAGKKSQSIAHYLQGTRRRIPFVSAEKMKGKIIFSLPNYLFWGRIMTFLRMILIATTLWCFQASSQQGSSKPDWSEFQFLMGEWTGEGSGQPGQGNGTFSFSMDLQDHVLIRRNQSDYPESKTHAAFSHNDLMVIYQEPGQTHHAIYFDNEGHTIPYRITTTNHGTSATFTSDSLKAQPRFRLTYTSLSKDTLLITFEIVPPATPTGFIPYLAGKAWRTNINSDHHSEKNKK
jgi:hypothetical protein